MTNEDTYLTIKSPSEGFYKEKGSKFLAYAYPVTSEEEIKEKIDLLKKQYHDARHHCFAYILGPEADRYRAYDDGEPGHSAGDPILGQLRSNNLTDTLIVVVRYFGGTKLGVSGLINAYKTAASDAILNCRIVEKHQTRTYQIFFGYPEMNVVMKLVKDLDLTILDQDFQETCKIRIDVRLKFIDQLIEKLENTPNIHVEQCS